MKGHSRRHVAPAPSPVQASLSEEPVMATECEIRRCDRCALDRRYPAPPELTRPIPRGWEDVLAEVERLNVPLVAFGQTLFWDEPPKAILRLMLDQLAPNVPTIAGIHDSDYFSKLHGRGDRGEGFVVWANNDWSNRALWAAVGETTSLFGAEEPPEAAELHRAGVPLKHLAASSAEDADEFIDRVTSAYGWRGVAQLGPVDHIARDVKVSQAGDALVELLDWGMSETIGLLVGSETQRAAEAKAQELSDRLRGRIAEMQDATVAQLYERLIIDWYADVLGYRPKNMTATTTGDYLQFNRETCTRARFQAVQSFLCHKVGLCATETYNDAVAGQGMYGLDQFGEGAIPFDLIVPGRGRGTVRILDREIRAELETEPLVIRTAERCTDVEGLAELIEGEIGTDAALCGKALLGPVMFCSEAILVLHEGASSYVPRTQLFLSRLNSSCGSIRTYPILRLRHRAYDALASSKVSFRLPDHLAEAFGSREITASEFGGRWRKVCEDQQNLIKRLRRARGPKALLDIIAEEMPDGWDTLADELESALREIGADIDHTRERLASLRESETRARGRRGELERRSGGLRREELDGADPEPRQALRTLISVIAGEVRQYRARRRELCAEITELAKSAVADDARATIARITREVEIKRMAIARRALLTTHMELGNRRPTGWWFSVADPSGDWFQEAVRLSEVWLEDLTNSDCCDGCGAS